MNPPEHDIEIRGLDPVDFQWFKRLFEKEDVLFRTWPMSLDENGQVVSHAIRILS